MKMCEFSVKCVNVPMSETSLQITVRLNKGDTAYGSAQ